MVHLKPSIKRFLSKRGLTRVLELHVIISVGESSSRLVHRSGVEVFAGLLVDLFHGERHLAGGDAQHLDPDGLTASHDFFDGVDLQPKNLSESSPTQNKIKF